MKIAYNPRDAAALVLAPANNDITFDLSGLSIYVKGVRFKGTDTTYTVFRKDTKRGGGHDGLVPVPNYNGNSLTRYLREDGTWLYATDVKQSEATDTDFRPVVLGLTHSATLTELVNPVTGQVYVTSKIYTCPSTGILYATKLYSNGKEVLTEHQSLADYVTLNTAQNITGTKTFASNTFILAGIERNDIKHATQRAFNWGGYGDTNTTPNDTGMYNSLDFYWYNDIWSIGNLRSGNSKTNGFGIGLKKQDSNNNLYFAPAFRVTETASYINNNVIWHAGNDGSGSGLDADLLDGKHASDFATNSHTHPYLPLSGGTMTGPIKFLYNNNGNCNVSRTSGFSMFYGNQSDATNYGFPFQYSSVISFMTAYCGMQFANYGGNGDNRLLFRNISDQDRWTPWYTLLHSGNYNSFAPTLTGSGASGTWGINITGNATTATNADTVDGYHASDFARVVSSTRPTYINYLGYGYATNSWYTYGPTFTFGIDSYYARIQKHYNSNSLYLGGYSTELGDLGWREFAFTDSNVASATKLQTARTITLTGSITGSVSFDGTSNVSIATSTNHTHSFESLTSRPTTIGGYGITDALYRKSIKWKRDYERYVILLCKIGTNTTNTNNTINGVFYTDGSGTDRYLAAYVNIHCSDWSTGHNEYYGFTPFGIGTACRLVTCKYQSSTYLAVTFENIQACQIYFDGSYSNILFTPILYYTSNTGVINNSEIYNSISAVTSYNKLAFTTDNVASATKLQTARTIWGQSFDGTGNVSGALTGVTTITTSGQICINTSSSLANNYNEGIRCNLGGSSNWASIVLGGASGSTLGSGIGVYSLLVNSGLFQIRQNITEVLCINTSNNVGIGTTSPSYKLHVEGQTYSSSGFIKGSSSDSYVLLGGGGHKALSDFALGNYLPISGGTMTGAINSTYSSGSYIGGVSNACLNGAYTGYGAILSMPIASGRVSLSTYPGGSSNLVYLGYASSSQISNGTNSFNKALTWDAVNNNLTADTFTGALAGNAATASKWKSPITLTISGSVTGSASVDGSGNVTISTSTNHSHSGYLTSHQTIYSLYLRSGSFSDVTYTPNYCNEWVYIPTTTDHLTEGTTNLFYTDARVLNIVSDKYLPLAGGTMNKDATIGSNTSLYVGSNNNWLYVSNIGSRNGTAYWEISQAGVAKFKGTVTASEFLGNASSASTVTVNNSDSNSTYRMVWHSGSTLYETSGIYCNPSSKVLYAGGFYHTGYGASGYALTADGGATFIRDMSVNYANSAGTATTATTASKLDTNAGSSTNPVYFSGGIPVACTGVFVKLYAKYHIICNSSSASFSKVVGNFSPISSVSRMDTGKVKINFSSGYSWDRWFVFATGRLKYTGNSMDDYLPVYVSLSSQYSSYLIASIQNDSSRDDGLFYFYILEF